MAKAKATQATANTTPALILNKITVTSVNRETLDVGKLKRIIKRAESDSSPNRTGLYDMYTNICFDEHVTSETQKLLMSVTNSELLFVNDKNEEVPEMMDLIDTTEFEEVLEEIVNSKLWGISLAQFKAGTRVFEPSFIERKNIRPIQGIVANDQNSDEGENYRVPPYQYWMLEVGKPKDLGLLMKAAFWVIIKRGGVGDWAELCEIFGMPIRVGEYDAFDEATRMELEKALSEMGSASYIMKPKGSEVTLIESKSSSPGTLHESLVNICNKAISILFLGQTLTTLDKSGSGQAQGTVHADTKEEIVKAYKRFVRRVLNRKLMPILENLGYPVKGGKFIFRDQIPVAERLQMMKLLQMVKALGAPVADDDIYQQSGVPKPKDYDALKEEIKANRPDFPQDEEVNNEPVKKPAKKPVGGKNDLNWWLRFRTELADFFDPAR